MFFGYSLLNISSAIRDLKLEGMLKYKKSLSLAHRYVCLMILGSSELYEDLF